MTHAVECEKQTKIEPELYTVQDTARILSISVASVYRLISRSELKSVKLGGRALVTRVALNDLLRGIGA
ncbi:MAG: helix-turn-helix domain-containing protein [Bosea sp.]|uniref:helix-turn-helix domain-containing protein n=1 Tax=unclassified Bosea (in: a-proteobacteria) TaxID=2653178 RepID=UPI000AA47B33|nr:MULTISPECIES: helix-turn-helix domain-containing protein [unclassified Bosea (in: a-proteobacteria)]MBN9457383.1 helix-turn-helix domain-containing protein [Bosea sp. (in: a-proteobacteria)]